MYKRRIEPSPSEDSTSSSSSSSSSESSTSDSDADATFNSGYPEQKKMVGFEITCLPLSRIQPKKIVKSCQTHLSKGKVPPKKARNGAAVSVKPVWRPVPPKKASNGAAVKPVWRPVTSTATQLPPKAKIVVKREIEVIDVEVEITPQTMGAASSSSAAGQRSQTEVTRSNGGRASSKKVSKDPKLFLSSKNSHHTSNFLTLPSPLVPKIDAVSVDRDEDAAFARVKKRMLDTRQKLRETVEANKALSTVNSKLVVKINEFEATVGELNGQLNSYSGKITTLEKNLKLKDIEKETQKKNMLQLRAENSELQANLEKEKEENEECQKKLEKIRSEVQNLEELFDDDMTENGTGT